MRTVGDKHVEVSFEKRVAQYKCCTTVADSDRRLDYEGMVIKGMNSNSQML
jgi:hypothetical protein